MNIKKDKSKLKKAIITLIKLIFTSFMIWMALRKIPSESLHQSISKINPINAIISILLFVVLIIPIESARFRFSSQLLQEIQPNFKSWVTIFTESRPFFYLLPASIGAEGMIWIRLRQHNWHHTSCAFVVFYTRITGMALWSAGAAFSLLFKSGIDRSFPLLPDFFHSPAPWLIITVATLIITLILPYILQKFNKITLSNNKSIHIAQLLVATLLSALLNTITIQLAANAAHINMRFDIAIGFLAFFNFSMILPISLGGFGIQEALLIAIGTPLGYNPSDLIACSIIIHMQRITLATSGGCIFLLNRKST